MLKPSFLFLLVVSCAFAQAPKAVSYSAETSNLIALERAWNQAQVSRDSSAIAAMIGDRFVNTETFRIVGEVQNVEEMASEIRRGRASVERGTLATGLRELCDRNRPR